MVNSLKEVSSRRLRQEYDSHIRRHRWSGHFWSGSLLRRLMRRGATDPGRSTSTTRSGPSHRHPESEENSGASRLPANDALHPHPQG
nr:transposase [Streptomyces agglomeratus]